MDGKRDDILIVVAHSSESDSVEKAMQASGCGCELLVTGVGGAAMSWSLQKRFSSGPVPPLVINAGIAGSYVSEIVPGDIVIARSECFADMGIDDNGSFVSVFNASLADPDKYPFSEGRIRCQNRWFDLLSMKYRPVNAATVNMSSGSQAVIDRIIRSWNPDTESMEGAWFAYACAIVPTDWISVRAISNRVEPRNMKNWDIGLALQKLSEAMAEILVMIRQR